MKQELDGIQVNYLKYAHFYSEYYSMKLKFEQSEVARRQDQADFQSQVLEILKEFQPFQEYFE